MPPVVAPDVGQDVTYSKLAELFGQVLDAKLPPQPKASDIAPWLTSLHQTLKETPKYPDMIAFKQDGSGVEIKSRSAIVLEEQLASMKAAVLGPVESVGPTIMGIPVL